MSNEKEGWVYCISNPEMPTLLKIGMTDRTPQERLAEANRSDTWRPPVDFKIEFAKKVKNALKKEKTLHKLLEQYNERVNRSREFFRITVEKARLYFDLMDGEMWEPSEVKKEISEPPKRPARKKKGGANTNVEENTENKTEENIIIYPSDTNTSLEVNTKLFDILMNANIKDLTAEEANTIIRTAYNQETLAIKLGKRFYRFYELTHINPHRLKKTVFEAHIVEAPDGINSIDEDFALYISKHNYTSILKTLKDTRKTQYIILSEICKL